MRCAFCSRAFSVSTNTHTADSVPRTPNVACAKRMASFAVMFTAGLRFPAASVPTPSGGRPCSWRLSLSGLFGLFAPGPIEPQVGVVFALASDGVAVGEEQLKARISKFVVTAHVQQGGGSGLWCRQTFWPVIEDLRAQRPASCRCRVAPASQQMDSFDSRSHAPRGRRAFLRPRRTWSTGPKLFCAQSGTLYHVLPTPKPLAALPVGSSNMTNVPICGRCLLS